MKSMTRRYCGTICYCAINVMNWMIRGFISRNCTMSGNDWPKNRSSLRQTENKAVTVL